MRPALPLALLLVPSAGLRAEDVVAPAAPVEHQASAIPSWLPDLSLRQTARGNGAASDYDLAQPAELALYAPANGSRSYAVDAGLTAHTAIDHVGPVFNHQEVFAGVELHRNTLLSNPVHSHLVTVGDEMTLFKPSPDGLQLFPTLSASYAEDHLTHGTGIVGLADFGAVWGAYIGTYFNVGGDRFWRFALLPRFGLEAERDKADAGSTSSVLRGYAGGSLTWKPFTGQEAFKPITFGASALGFSDLARSGDAFAGVRRNTWLATLDAGYDFTANAPQGSRFQSGLKFSYVNGEDPVFLRQPRDHYWKLTLDVLW